MIEMTIHGRGGQGGVTLAKLIATAYFLQDKHVQAFGVYAAERSGAPLQAFVRVDDVEITNHNQIESPDHLIVLDRTLIHPTMAAAMRGDGWIIVNSPDAPEQFETIFPGRRVAVVDATRIAVANGLGTRAVPIVNTTMFGAVAKCLGLDLADVERALAHVKFGGANIASVRAAYEATREAKLSGSPLERGSGQKRGATVGLLDDTAGGAVPLIKTGSWASRQPHRQRLTPPCNHGCPAGNDVQGFIHALNQRDTDRALEILLETSPLPGVCGRVCPAPCMEACNRTTFDEAVNIRELERYAADHGRREGPTIATREEHVAVVGSGPAGLSAAYALARLGYQVTLFEAGAQLGGLLRTGIPAYRLPRDVLDREIGFIIEHGVRTRLNHRVDRAELLRLTRDHDAVFLATGLQHLQSLQLSGPRDAVLQGIDFLDRASRHDMRADGEHVVVVGGGNTAIDAARTARRLGARSVRIVYRRTRNEMPAIREEIDEALEEGVHLYELMTPLRLRSDGAGLLLTCQRMRLGEPDESGRRSPIPETTDDAQVDLRCDRVLLALGQSADLSILPAGAEIHDGGVLLGLTQSSVFACGDFATNDGTVTAAIGSGRRAALHVHRTISGEDLFPTPSEPVATPDVITTHVFEHAPRRGGEMLTPWTRRHSFAEVRRGFLGDGDNAPAYAEASRCFSCGVCNQCDRCVQHCPEGIMVRDGDGYRFDENYCKGCGVCASECPRGVIYMTEL